MTDREKERAIEELEILKDECGDEWLSPKQYDDRVSALDMGIKALKQEDVLDSLREEIESKYGDYDICEFYEDYDYEENNISEYMSVGSVADILEIIDKYKKNSEG